MSRLILAFFLSILGYGQIMSPIVAGSGGAFTLTATTVGASKTVTITRLTLNGIATLNWGDGSTTVITSQSTGTWTHVYATGGTYTIKLPNARMIVGLQLSDAQLGGMNTNQLRSSSINYFYVTAITGSTIRSADMSAWRPTNWYLFSMPTGTYTISSAGMSAWRPANWALYAMPTGTYTISSADMSAWRPAAWYLLSMPTGTYTISSADMSAWRPAAWELYAMPTGGTYSISSADMSAWRPTTWELYAMPTGTYSISSADMSAWTMAQNIYLYANVGQVTTINSYTDFTGLVALRNLQLQNNALTQAQVNAVLQGLWTARASFTYATPSLTINGTNADPSGIYQTNCPTPATGKEWAYDLVHETCTGGGYPWTVTTN